MRTPVDVDGIAIEVAYALPDDQFVAELRMPAGSTAVEAIERSGVLQRFPGIDLGSSRLGIFGRPCDLNTRLADGDRVEIHRPLSADIKNRRRERVAATRKKRNQ